MINWGKPILIGGFHRLFKLAGTLNDSQLVVTTDGTQGQQMLFFVNEHGDSSFLHNGKLFHGPKFSNEPPKPVVTNNWTNVYSDGELGGVCRDRQEAESTYRNCFGTLKRVGMLRTMVAVHDDGNVTVTSHFEKV